jgi:predicted nucleic acid-binding protein
VNVVDSSAWLEYLADGPNASFFAPAIEAVDELLVPAVVVYEVFRRVLQQRGEDAALQAVALLHQGEIVDVDSALALFAARLGAEHKLPLADSLVYAAARLRGALLWTQDSDFKELAEVRFRTKRGSK